MKVRFQLVVYVGALALFSWTTAHAQTTLTWIGRNSSMQSSDNWSPRQTPSTSSDLYFGSNGSSSVTADANISVHSLTFGANSQSYTFTSSGSFFFFFYHSDNHYIGIGSGGITSAASSHSDAFNTDVHLLANQTWNLGNHVTVSGQISGNFLLTKQGIGTLTLNDSNSYSGGTKILAGKIEMMANSALGPGFVQLGDDSILYADTSSPSIGSLSDVSGHVSSKESIQLTSHVHQFTINQTSDGTYSGSITGSAAQLIKQGSATLTLAGASNYAGGTAINNGILVAANDSALGASSGGVVVNPHGTLAVPSGVTVANNVSFGNGSNNGTAPVIGGLGTLAPTSGLISVDNPGVFSPGDKGHVFGGPTVGTLNLSANVSIGSNGGAYNWGVQDLSQPDGTGSDLIAITGSLAFNNSSESPFKLSLYTYNLTGSAGVLAGFNSTQSYQWEIVSAGSISGFSSSLVAIDTTNFQNPLNGGSFSVSQGGNNLYLNFNPAVIPEPATWMLLLSGMGMLSLLARRRRA